jgi:quercetin dioxygenase-like cupin family protein
MLALALGLCGAIFQAAIGQEKPTPASKKASASPMAKHVVIPPSDIKWEDAPPSLPPGAKVAVLYGDPAKSGPFTLRAKAPDGYKVPAHWHPTTEYVTVLSGTLYMGTGDKLDESKGSELKAGGFSSMPAKMRHFVWMKGDTEFEIHGNGPFQVTYVNPQDDPRKAKK